MTPDLTEQVLGPPQGGVEFRPRAEHPPLDRHIWHRTELS